MYDVLLFGYVSGVLACGIGGCFITLYVCWRYENALAGMEWQLEKCRRNLDTWKKIADDRLPLRKAAAEERAA
jgi:hypothetical protein